MSAGILRQQDYLDRLKDFIPYKEAGKVTKSLGLIYEAHLPGASVGSFCRVFTRPNQKIEESIEAEVIGFRDKHVLLMPFEEISGINSESRVLLTQRNSSYRVSSALLGRVIDGRGRAMDGKGPIILNDEIDQADRPLYHRPLDPLKRAMIREPLDLGIRTLNGLITCGKGQRMGIMAGSGVGKSVLLGMMARNTRADVNVIALIGERGREVREFIERDLGPEGLARSVVIVATSDTSPLLRVRGAFLAATIAEYFRDRGKDVLLMMDSVTRFCMAQREIGLSMGEPPTSKGYTPSVFSLLPKLLERAGTAEKQGSITGLYTVLVEGDDLDEPIADASRSILDGHVVLSRKISERNQFPAIDVLASTSRVMSSIVSKEQREWAGKVREWMAVYQSAEDLINIGAYAKGSNPKVDQAVFVMERILAFLRQGMHEKASYDETLSGLHGIVRVAEAQFASGIAR